MPFLPTPKFKCVCVKDSTHRWLSFIEGNIYVVNSLKYANEQVDTTHNSVDGVFRHKNGDEEIRRITMSKEDCKEYLKIIPNEK